MPLQIDQQQEKDWPEVWAVLEPAFRAGESYPLPLDVSESDAKEYWIKKDGFNAVARNEAGELVGIYYLRPDQGGPGSHICNAGYVIAEQARRKGYAVELCLQSQDQARAMGFKGMKYNLVVASNKGALKAWKKAGMEIIGTVPGAFRHPRLGLTDAYILFKSL